MATTDTTIPRSARAEARTDDAAAAGDVLARRFSERLAQSARYVAAWRRWLLFDGVAWRPDTTLRIFSEARATCRDAAGEVSDPRVRARIGSAAAVAAVEKLARADQRHAAGPELWDSDPFLLNTPAGTIFLRTGEMRPHRCDDYMTRSTAVAPGGDCPLFRAFLDRIFAGDEALIGFVQRTLGYALTGALAEHALFFAYGTGGNGKGVLLNTVIDILGGYAAAAPMETFAATQRERHPGDLAMLHGARLVVAQETAEGRAWDEARLKALTGGDAVTVRHMRGDLFTYRPRFKLFIAGNHRPPLRTVDAAIRRRFKLIPFAVTIPEAEADRDLPRKLQAEWSGILAWMIAGCLEWQRIGLAPPPAVADATADYLAEEDTFGAWLEEKVERASESTTVLASNLFSSWEYYAEWAKEPAGSRKAFGRAMQARGFVPCRIGNARAKGYKGITLKTVASRRQYSPSELLAAMTGRKTSLEGA